MSILLKLITVLHKRMNIHILRKYTLKYLEEMVKNVCNLPLNDLERKKYNYILPHLYSKKEHK